MIKFKYFGIGIAIGIALALYILSNHQSFNWLGKQFICIEEQD